MNILSANEGIFWKQVSKYRVFKKELWYIVELLQRLKLFFRQHKQIFMSVLFDMWKFYCSLSLTIFATTQGDFKNEVFMNPFILQHDSGKTNLLSEHPVHSYDSDGVRRWVIEYVKIEEEEELLVSRFMLPTTRQEYLKSSDIHTVYRNLKLSSFMWEVQKNL